jgi:hypothetical protein
MIGQTVRRETSVSGPKRCAERSVISASNSGVSSAMQPPHLGPALHPDDGRRGARDPVLAGVVGQRHQRERPAGAVDLGRDILVRDRVRDGEGQRLLPVARVRTPMPAASRTAELRPSAAITSRARSRAPSLSVTRASVSRVSSCAVPMPGRKSAIGSRQMRHHLAPQQPVGQVPAERLVRDVGGVEIMGHARFRHLAARIHDAHDLQRHGVGRQPLPDADPVEKRLRRLQKGRGAQVRTNRVLAVGDRRRGIGADRAEPRLGEGDGGGQSRHTAAGDEDVDILDLLHGRKIGRGRGGGDAALCPSRGQSAQAPEKTGQVVGVVVDVIRRLRARAPHAPCASPSRAARRGCGDRPRTSRRGSGRARRSRTPSRRPPPAAWACSGHAPRRRPHRIAPPTRDVPARGGRRAPSRWCRRCGAPGRAAMRAASSASGLRTVKSIS